MPVRSPYAVLGVLLAAPCFLSAGCTALSTGAGSQPPALTERDLGLIGNNSAAIANQGLASLGDVLGDASGLRESKQSSPLVGNNSAALIGNNSAAYRVNALNAAGSVAWSDSGNWPTPLTASTSVSGVLSAVQGGTEFERYVYAHSVTGIESSPNSASVLQTAYQRTEDVLKSSYRQIGHYAIHFLIDQATGSPTQGAYLFTQDFTPSNGGSVRHLSMTHRYMLGANQNAGLDVETLTGVTSDGASVSMSMESQANAGSAADVVDMSPPGTSGAQTLVTVPANSLRYQQAGRIDVDGRSYAVTTDIGGALTSTAAVSTGSIDLVSFGVAASDSVKLHLSVTQGASGTLASSAELRDGNDAAIATVSLVPAAGIYLATFSNGATQAIPVDTVNKILSVATNHSNDNW